MDENTTPNEGQEPKDGGPQDGANSQGQGQAPKTYGEDYVKQLRDEAANYRTRLRDLEKKTMTDGERDAQELKELREYRQRTETIERDRTFADAVTTAARKAGALYPDRIHRIIDAERSDDGTPKNLDAAIKALKAEMPNLFAANGGHGSADAGAGRDSRTGADMNSIIRRGRA